MIHPRSASAVPKWIIQSRENTETTSSVYLSECAKKLDRQVKKCYVEKISDRSHVIRWKTLNIWNRTVYLRFVVI